MKIPKGPRFIFEIPTLSTDPGVMTGCAFWSGSRHPVTYSCGDAKLRGMSAIAEVWESFEHNLLVYKPHQVVIEDQWFSAEHLTSLTSARRGNLKKLAWVTGGLLQISLNCGCDVKMVQPIEWKGNMSDAMVRRRVKMIMGMNFQNVHVDCAVGIGLNEVDMFKDLKKAGVQR